MSLLDLNLKLKVPPHLLPKNLCQQRTARPPSTTVPPLPLREEIQPFHSESVHENTDHEQLWTYAARTAYVVALLPLSLLTRNENSVHRASYAYLFTNPFLAYIIQHFNQIQFQKQKICGWQEYAAFYVIPITCFTTGNATAVLFLLNNSNEPHVLLMLTLVLGCIQQLWILNKQHPVFRVMACTALAVLIIVLATAATLVPSDVGRQLFQSTLLPLILLCLETSRTYNNNNTPTVLENYPLSPPSPTPSFSTVSSYNTQQNVSMIASWQMNALS